MVELKGSLDGIGLSALVQLIGDLHHSGSLQLRRSNSIAELIFDNGRLVAAQCGEFHGLEAVAACVSQFIDAEFTFNEGNASRGLERTLDLSPSDLQTLLGRVPNGHHPAITNGATATSELPQAVACPLLGFADDRSRHYGRPTALHRCFARGETGLVTPTEQRELCLSGSFEACPRYRTASYQPIREVLPKSAPPASVVEPSRTQQTPEPVRPPERRVASRGALVIGGGVLAGLLVVALALFVALPFFREQRPAQRPASLALEPVATATTAPPAVVVAPTLSLPTPGPTFPPTPMSSVPGSAPRPTVAPLKAPLMDVRFAAGPLGSWPDNAPYASWSDGAYRLRASDAARFVALGVPVDQPLKDAIVSATLRKTGGPPGGGYGVIVRDQGPLPRDGVNQEMNAYVLETGDLGEYGIWRREGDHWVDLVPWTRSPSVRSGGSPNDLSVKAVGSNLTFTVNGQLLATVDDDTFDTGRIGLFVGGDFNEVAVDRLSVERP